jgi:hypothetical protein
MDGYRSLTGRLLATGISISVPDGRPRRALGCELKKFRKETIRNSTEHFTCLMKRVQIKEVRSYARFADIARRLRVEGEMVTCF